MKSLVIELKILNYEQWCVYVLSVGSELKM